MVHCLFTEKKKKKKKKKKARIFSQFKLHYKYPSK